MNLFQYGEDSTSESEGEKAQKGVETENTRARLSRMSSIEKETPLPTKEAPIEKSTEQPKTHEAAVPNVPIERKRQMLSESRPGEEKAAKIAKKETKAPSDPEEAKHWMAVFDSNTKKYYYWNQVLFPNPLHV